MAGTLSSPLVAHAVSVEEVTSATARRRFIELPQALHGDDPHFVPLLLAWERYRLDPHRNPFFEQGEAVLLLARRRGRPVGRVTAHRAGRGRDGCFGFWWADDDPAVASALVESAGAWLRTQGCTSMAGPWSFTSQDEAGVQVVGHEAQGTLGRPWHPPHLARLLEDLGFETVEDRPTWRLPAGGPGPELPAAAGRPGHAGPYADRRLVLEGIAAVPDVSELLRAPRLRSALALARHARDARWTTCTIVRCDGDPSAMVPALQAEAGRAGYRWVVAPWTPLPDTPPEAVHRVYRLAL